MVVIFISTPENPFLYNFKRKNQVRPLREDRKYFFEKWTDEDYTMKDIKKCLSIWKQNTIKNFDLLAGQQKMLCSHLDLQDVFHSCFD
jgi:hypothetical protein